MDRNSGPQRRNANAKNAARAARRRAATAGALDRDGHFCPRFLSKVLMFYVDQGEIE
jgi:hypothetical protein